MMTTHEKDSARVHSTHYGGLIEKERSAVEREGLIASLVKIQNKWCNQTQVNDQLE